MVSNISSCTKALVLLISLLGVSSFSLRAQEKDFATWANVGFEYKLKWHLLFQWAGVAYKG